MKSAYRYKTLSLFVRTKVIERDKSTCQHCGRRLKINECQVDHIVPQSIGGGNDFSNLVCSCKPCNLSRRLYKMRDTVAESKLLGRVEDKYFSYKQALLYLSCKRINRSIGWLSIEVLKKNIRTFKFYNSRVVLKEDIHKLAESLGG